MKTILLTIATMSCISLTAQVTEPIKAQEGTVTIDTLRQTITVDNGGDTTRIKLRKKKRIINSDSYKGTKHTDAIAGACSFYKTFALKKYGTGDEDFFFGPEDIELSWRLKKHGILLVNQDAVAYHKIARSSAISGIRIRTLNECFGFLMLIKKIGKLSDKLIGYTFFIFKSFYLISTANNKERQLRTLGYLQGLYNFFLKK